MTFINFQSVKEILLSLKFHQMLVTSFMVFLLWLIFMAATWGIADLFAKQVRYETGQWQKKQESLKVETWKLTQAKINWTWALEPAHPDFLEDMAGANFFLYRYGTITPAEKVMAVQQSLDYYLKAVKQQPSSALTWADIALMKSYLREYDAQFLMALENATSLGPWEPFVQQAVTEVGLAAWYRFPKLEREKGQSIVLANIERGMLRQTKLMTTLIKKYQREKVMCMHGMQKAVFSVFCW
jgi:hypothetical protein